MCSSILLCFAVGFCISVTSHALLSCPQKFIDTGNGYCIFPGFSPNGYNISEATKACVFFGGTLPTFVDDAEALGFSALAASQTNPAPITFPLTMGYYNSLLHSPTNPGVWHDSTNTSCSPMVWTSDQPDNVGGQEGCMQMTVGSTSYTLIDVPCSTIITNIWCAWRPNALPPCAQYTPTTQPTDSGSADQQNGAPMIPIAKAKAKTAASVAAPSTNCCVLLVAIASILNSVTNCWLA